MPCDNALILRNKITRVLPKPDPRIGTIALLPRPTPEGSNIGRKVTAP